MQNRQKASYLGKNQLTAQELHRQIPQLKKNLVELTHLSSKVPILKYQYKSESDQGRTRGKQINKQQ